jgi:DNA-binding transcriptional ArsR family regulator
MVVFSFSLEDLARTRFAVSPMWELAGSLQTLRDPGLRATHTRWVRGLRGVLSDLDLAAALRLVPTQGYTPDFLTPPPSGPLAEFAEQLAEMRAVPPDQVRREVGWSLNGQPAPPALAPFLSEPAAALGHLADQLEAYWGRALAPHWPRIRRLLDADLAHRARRLTEGGPAALFADLHPAVRWRGDRVEVETVHDRRLDLEGRGLLLLPSAFSPARPTVVLDPPWQPALCYPARGVALLWDPGTERAPEALAGVLGRTRAQILATLDAPRSTTELAEMLGITAGGASQHLTALRAAGLVAGRREGRAVLYSRTPAADALVEAAA